jgi:lipid A 4'-phosphatase
MDKIIKASKTRVLFPLLLMLGMSLLFVLYPQIDLWVASFYYHPDQGFAGRTGFWGVVYALVPWLVKGLGFLLLVVIFRDQLFKQTTFGWRSRHAVFVLLALALGPGLAVNTLFKDQWGRARPHQVEAFGGSQKFTPAWQLSDQCERNCSFVSGHASVGFFVMVGAFLFPLAFRQWMIAGVLCGLLVGWARIVQGGHFLSDVIFSGFVVYWVLLACAHWLLRAK